MKLKLFALLLFTGFFNASIGQISLRMFHYNPTNMFGYVFKKTASAELGYQFKDFESGENRWRYKASVSFIKLNPRMDAFPTYGVENGTYLLPQELSYHQSILIPMFGGVDFAFINKDKVKTFIGTDLIFGMALFHYTDYGYVMSEEFSGGGRIEGLRFRVGADYTYSDELSFSISSTRQFFIIREPLMWGEAYDIGLAAHYTF